MNWISVNERLPEPNVSVLICNVEGHSIDEMEPAVAHFDGDTFIGLSRVDYDNYWIEEATHWMPLPELPEEKV